jgi:hypothetical protein
VDEARSMVEGGGAVLAPYGQVDATGATSEEGRALVEKSRENEATRDAGEPSMHTRNQSAEGRRAVRREQLDREEQR